MDGTIGEKLAVDCITLAKGLCATPTSRVMHVCRLLSFSNFVCIKMQVRQAAFSRLGGWAGQAGKCCSRSGIACCLRLCASNCC